MIINIATCVKAYNGNNLYTRYAIFAYKISMRFQSVRVNAIELIIHMTFSQGHNEMVGLYYNRAI